MQVHRCMCSAKKFSQIKLKELIMQNNKILITNTELGKIVEAAGPRRPPRKPPRRTTRPSPPSKPKTDKPTEPTGPSKPSKK